MQYKICLSPHLFGLNRPLIPNTRVPRKQEQRLQDKTQTVGCHHKTLRFSAINQKSTHRTTHLPRNQTFGFRLQASGFRQKKLIQFFALNCPLRHPLRTVLLSEAIHLILLKPQSPGLLPWK